MAIMLRVLIIEDAENDVEALLHVLRQGGYDPIAKHVDNATAMIAALADSPLDVVISEYNLQRFSTLSALTIFKESDLDIPFIIISDTRGESTVIEALKAGAHNFLPKEDPHDLITTLQRELKEAAARRKIKQAEIARQEEIRVHTAELEQRIVERTMQLNRVKDRVEAILNSSSDIIILISADGSIEQVNPVFNDMLGYASDEVFRQSFLMIAAPDFVEQLKAVLYAVSEDLERKRIEINVLCKDGSTFDADLALAPLVEDGKVSGIVCSLRDMTERKRIEEKLRQALEESREINEFKTRFLSMVSHDVRTPLTIIQLSTETLQKYYDRLDIPRRARYFEKIQRQIKHMIALLNDVLTINQSEIGKLPFNPVPMSLDKVCRGVVSDFQEMIDLEHHLIYSCVEEPTQIMVDEILLHQVVTNLLTNAFKYSTGGSSVYFDVTFDTANAVIRVKDSGIGIPEADQASLFEVFRRAGNVGKIEGTGLGLAIVKRAVQAHGGTVSFESEIGLGTTFIVKLPLHQEKLPTML